MKRISQWGLLVLAGAVTAGCGSISNPGSTADRELLHSRVQAAMADFHAADPSLKAYTGPGRAYAIFPQVVAAAVGFGGAHGDGEVYQDGKLIGYADVSQASIGAQLGGQKYAELILFETQSALLDFQNGTVEFDARATAVAASKGAASTANYQHGVMVLTLPEGGLMAQAAVGGQKFRFRPVSVP